MDRINLFDFAGNDIRKVFSTYSEYIKNETLTNSVTLVKKPDSDMKKWDVNGKEVYLKIEKSK